MTNIEMKDSGIKWIGEIPSKWNVSKIKFEVPIIGSGSTPESSNLEYYSDNSFGWIQSGDLYQKQYIKSTEKTITEHAIKRYSTLKFYEKDFVVIAMYGASTGNVSYSMISAYTNQACCVLKTSEDNCLKYLFYFIVISRESLIRMADGGTQPNISQEKIKNIPFLKPSINEQRIIACFLDKKCLNIDSIINDLEEQIEILEKYKKSVITEAVTKGLSSNFQMKEVDLVWGIKTPTHWDVKRIKNVCIVERGGSPRPIDLYLSNDINDMSWIKIGDTVKGSKYINSTEQQVIKTGVSKSRKVFKGDLLLTNSMSFGQPYILRIDGCIHDGWLVFSNYKDINKEFLYYVLMSNICLVQFKVAVSGAVVSNLNIDKVKDTKILIPKIEEQVNIVLYLDRKCSEIESIIENKKNQVETIKKYKNSLIYEYVTGKKRVSQGDVNE